jgi:DNA ligase-1
MDGEIIVGEPNAHDVFNRTDTFWKRHDMVTPFSYYAFDDFSRPDWKYYDRYRKLSDRIRSLDQSLEGVRVHLLAHNWVNSEQELLEEEERILLLGYEGVIIRCPNGPYKFNRTTEREQNAFKLKRFIDSEARIVGFVEELHNANEALVNELGRTKRQTLQENMIPKGTLGSFIVQDVQENDASHKFYGVTFNIGSGFDAADRILYWNDCEKYYGKLVTYKYFAPGSKDAPRHPIFKGIRDESDMLQ